MKKLVDIQSELKAPKNLYNSFGNYKFRNVEGILSSVKPLLKKYNCTLKITDEIIQVGERYYVRSTAVITDQDSSEYEIATALAREALNKKGMDESQITGSASSYARKYALNGLFLLDDTKDADSTNKHGKDKENADRPNFKYMKVLETINGTPIKYSNVKAWIKKEFGKEIHPNDLSDQQYAKLINALNDKIDEALKENEAQG